ncbi:hypothetical protein GNP73_08370 [Aliivibrio fischeri]|uniref:hypothetical protein n=1 Tax=Aliivibrio fischeri TaxID=668 RepID=UPI0012DA8AAE|nr:hypothetical protein [Aliivibrio fischeri]MUJ27988.1 hypothetical protein [Aliivibrio fischeri]
MKVSNKCSLCSCHDVTSYNLGIHSILICNNCLDYLGHLYIENYFSTDRLLSVTMFNIEASIRSLKTTLPYLVGSKTIDEYINGIDKSISKLSELTNKHLPHNEIQEKINHLTEELNTLVSLYK